MAASPEFPTRDHPVLATTSSGRVTEPSVELVESRESFARLIHRLGVEAIIGIDTEAASFHRYHDRVYLLQLSSRDHTAVVDPILVPGLPGLGDWLRADATEFVFHDGDYDMRLLRHEFGFRVARLFDTRIAAQFLGEPGIGLAALLEKHFGVSTDKRFQRADWSLRPLSMAMLEYAATDTKYLPALRDVLRGELEHIGRLAWVEEECELLTAVEWAPEEPPARAFLRLKGARALDRRGLAILRELFVWREETAARLDRALFRVMSNETLVAIAGSRPRSPDALDRIRGVGRDTAGRRGGELLAAVERGLVVPDSELPRFERPIRFKPDPEFETVVARLKAWRTGLAEQLKLPPGLVAPNALLESVARQRPVDLDQLAATSGVRRWQVTTFGAELLKAARGGDGA